MTKDLINSIPKIILYWVRNQQQMSDIIDNATLYKIRDLPLHRTSGHK